MFPRFVWVGLWKSYCLMPFKTYNRLCFVLLQWPRQRVTAMFWEKLVIVLFWKVARVSYWQVEFFSTNQSGVISASLESWLLDPFIMMKGIERQTIACHGFRKQVCSILWLGPSWVRSHHLSTTTNTTKTSCDKRPVCLSRQNISASVNQTTF